LGREMVLVIIFATLDPIKIGSKVATTKEFRIDLNKELAPSRCCGDLVCPYFGQRIVGPSQNCGDIREAIWELINKGSLWRGFFYFQPDDDCCEL
jgi:hypothetical protein